VAADKKPSKAKKVGASPAKVTSLKQTSIFILSLITALTFLALVTYNPSDPGLFHLDRNAVIQNKAGAVGAYLADVLMGFLGYLSYLIPVVFIVSAFLLFRSVDSKKNNINLGITVFGVFLALFSSYIFIRALSSTEISSIVSFGNILEMLPSTFLFVFLI